MDTSNVFKIAADYRLKYFGKKTLDSFFNNDPVWNLEKIEFYLNAIRYVHTLWFTKINPLSQWESVNKNAIKIEALTFLKHNKIVWSKLYWLASKYLLEAGWNKLFDNITEESIIKYYKEEITIEEIYKKNTTAFDFKWLTWEWYSYENINTIHTVKLETVEDIFNWLDMENEWDLELIEQIQAITEARLQRSLKCFFIIYIYYKNKWSNDEIKAKEKLMERFPKLEITE